MADLRISELYLHETLQLSDLLPIVNANSTRRVTTGTLGTFILASNLPITSSGAVFNGDVFVNGNIVSSQLVSASIIFESGSTIFGNDLGDTHRFTGSMSVSGSFTINGEAPVVSGSISGSTIFLNKSDDTELQMRIPPGLGQSGLGWARYDDTAYTTGSAFVVTAGASDVILPNNGSGSIETHMNSSVAFYNADTQKIQVENDGDVYVMTITFRARAAANPSTGDGFYIRLGNTTGTPYSRVRKDFYWPKTDQNWYYFHEVIQFYADSDFVTNGNSIQVHTTGVNAEFADVIYFIQRTQNHGGE